MPDIISAQLRDAPFLIEWFQWGTLIGFLITLVAALWVFIDAQRTGRDDLLWKTLAAIAPVVAVPALLAQLHAGFAFEMRDALTVLAGLSIAATLLALIALIAYLATGGSSLVDEDSTILVDPPEPVDSQSNADGHTYTGQAVGGDMNGQAPGFGPADGTTIVFSNGGGPGGRRNVRTVVLNEADRPGPVAFLTIITGVHKGTTLPLKDDGNPVGRDGYPTDDAVTTLGRDGTLNDFPLDDPAVSNRHLSIRCKNGQFILTDLDTSNGTKINGQPVNRQVLQPNDVIHVGKTDMVFVRVNTDLAARAAGPAQTTPAATPTVIVAGPASANHDQNG